MTLWTCWDCGRTYEAARARCDCGEGLWIPFETEGASLPADPGSMWAFADLLPANDPGDGLAGAAGGTPLVRTPGLDDAVDAAVSVKLEGTNPTGSFKDRGSALGVAAAVDAGADAVGTVSHGNMAASMAAHAAAADLPCHVLVPADIAQERLARIAQYGPDVVRVEGDYGALYDRALAVGRERGIAFVNSDHPLRVAGQATTLLETVVQGDPDAVVLPVSSGGHASGAWQAIRALRDLGHEPPTLHLVQAAACAPIAEAFARGDDEVAPVAAGETVAYSIANADPPSGRRALAAVRDTGGRVLAVDDDAILAAQADLASEGVACEPASATTLAAARELAADGALDGERVALVATGQGYGAAGDGGVDAPTVDLDGLATALGEP